MGRHRTPEEKAELGEQARAMRAAGKSRREIAAELHIGDDLLSELLVGTEVPASLRRRKAKDHLRDRARELRQRFRLNIHESGDESAALDWWSQQLAWPRESFQRTTFKTHNPKTVRKNTGSSYRGCVVITVLQSRDLYRALDGLVRGLALQPRAGDVDGSMGEQSSVA